MKKTMLLFTLLFTVSTAFMSCRETREEENEIELRTDEVDEVGDEIEDAADDVENTVEEGVDEIEENTTDDI